MKKRSLIERLFYIYSFLFIFSSINREFLFFGIDLRYIMLPLGLIVLLFSKHIKSHKDDNEKSRQIDGIFYSLVALFVWCLISNVSWLWNGLDIKIDQMINQNILIVNNLLAIFVYKRFRDFVDEQTVRKIFVFSCCVLVISFILTGMGLSLSQISGSNVRSVSVSNAIIEHKNLFGGSFRLAGYAEDANYASIFLVVGVLSVLQIETKRIYKMLLSAIFVIAFGFSCSKTILIALPIGLIYYLFVKRIKKGDNRSLGLLNSFVLIGVLLSSFMMPKIDTLSNTNTLSTRFKLWGIANETFSKSPLIGNGISAARSAINMKYNHDWYVQPHSSIWQILAEAGIVGLILFGLVFVKRLSLRDDSDLDKVAVVILLLFSLNFEIIQLQIVVYLLYILPVLQRRKEIIK